MRPSKKIEKQLFEEIDKNKDNENEASQSDIQTLSHIMIHDLGAEKASEILHNAGFYDHLNVDCKLDYDKWIYVDKANRSGAGKNSFHDITWKLLYEMKNEYLNSLNKK